MDILIGIGLLVWGAGLFIWQQFFSDGLTTQSILQIVVAIIGCLIILAPKVFNLLMNFELPDTEKEDEIKLDDQVDYEDFKALNYLKDRARQIESEEAFDLVVKLNTLIFSGELDEK
tara:strand:+ start:276 stop:626 length:351 start_codon:yes stop_codon:yes gene_type:complete